MEIEESVKANFRRNRDCLGSACRACFALPAAEEWTAESVWACSGVELKPSASPLSFCSACSGDLRAAHSFRRRCVQSEALLRDAVLAPPAVKVEVKLEVEDEDDLLLSALASVARDDALSIKSEIEPKKRKRSALKTRKTFEKTKTRRQAGPFRCTECPHETKRHHKMVEHMRVHTGEKPFTCEVCGKAFSLRGALAEHGKSHTDRMYFTCAECGKQFKRRQTYFLHRKTVHATEAKYVCDICNKGLKHRHSMISHLNRHYNIKNVSCETCGRTFVGRADLASHSTVHETEKKHECGLCDFRTHSKRSLKMHLVRHTGEKPYQCDMCERRCYTKDQLAYHYRKHTKEKRYACPVCEARFAQSGTCNRHMMQFHGAKSAREVDRRVIK